MIFSITNLAFKNDWITLVFLFIFLLLVVVKLMYKERLFELVTLFASKKYVLHHIKDNQVVISWFNFTLFIVQILVLGLLTLVFIYFYRPEITSGFSFLLFSKIIGTITIFFIIRYILGLLLSLLLEEKQRHEYIILLKTSYLYSSILIILPLLLFVFYMKTDNLFVFHLTIAIFTILLIVRYIFVLRNNKNLIFSQLFYFILYICALEIAPLLLIFKTIV